MDSEIGLNRLRPASVAKNHLARILLVLLLALPILGSAWYQEPGYQESGSWTWPAQALAGLALLLWCCHEVLSAMRRAGIPWLTAVVSVALAQSIAWFQVLRLVSFYFQGESFNRRFLFHVDESTLAVAVDVYPGLLVASLFYLVVVAWMALRVAASYGGRSSSEPNTKRGVRRALPLVSLVLVGLVEPDIRQLIASRERAADPGPEMTVSSIDWHSAGLNPEAVTTRSSRATPGSNLLLIYLESLEAVYTDSAVFPGLTPGLDRWMDRGVVFTDVRQTQGTEWTISGMVASQCGTPLLVSSGAGGNDVLHDGFLGEASCLGDVLRQAGYRQVYFGGANTEFAGKRTFLQAHGYDEVWGRDELSERVEDPSYQSTWGWYDDTLLELATEEFAELASGEEPFQLTLLTLDAHHPWRPSRSCEAYGSDDPILKAVHCTDQLVARYLEELQNHPAWRNTVVVLFSDHQMMRFDDHDVAIPPEERRLLFAAIGAGLEGTVDAPGTHMDVAPTVLDLLGVQHEQAFLAGRSLLAESTAPEIPPDDPYRLQATRLVNSHLLSRGAGSLCGLGFLVEATGSGLRVAGHDVALSSSGLPLEVGALAGRHALLVLLGEAGRITSRRTVNVENLRHVLFQYQAEPFLLIAPSESLDWLMGPGPAGIAVVLGSRRGTLRRLATVESARKLRVRADTCEMDLAAVVESLEDAEPVAPSEICSPDDAVPSFFAEDRLHLPSVAFQSVWFEAVFLEEEGVFRLETANANGEIHERPPPRSRCHAYYGNGELIVPRVRRGGALESLVLRQIPGRKWEFEAVNLPGWKSERISRPEP